MGIFKGARPRVAVTGPVRGGAVAWNCLHFAVWTAGGDAVRFTPARPAGLAGIEAVILSGGADIDPVNYLQERRTTPRRHVPIETPADLLLFPLLWIVRAAAARRGDGKVDVERDKLELDILAEAVERKLPVLGICRGAQLLNVFFGGTLYQELTGLYVEEPEIRTILPRKAVLITEGSVLASLIGTDPLSVNALHRQAVKDLGRGIRISARDRNGIVQAIEHPEYPFLIGVQWHPEFLPLLKRERLIFRAFIECAKSKRVDGQELW